MENNNILWKTFLWWAPSLRRLSRYIKLQKIVAFHSTRWQFIYHRNLKRDFCFSFFLRKLTTTTFITLVEINPWCWVLLIIFVLLDVLRHNEIAKFTDFAPIFFMTHSIINAVIATILYFKIRKSYRIMTENPSIYCATDEALQHLGDEVRKPQRKVGTTHSREHSEVETGSEHNPIYHNMAVKSEEIGQQRHNHSSVNLDVKNSVRNESENKSETEEEPNRKYPKWVTKVFPSLGRKRSVQEKLFWFGSHRFYLFCLECVIFFMNINLAAVIAKLIYWFKITNRGSSKKSVDEGAKVVKDSAKLIINSLVRAAASGQKQAEDPGKLSVRIPGLVVGLVMTFYILILVARIMRKYIFVIHNADLVSDFITETTIRTIDRNALLDDSSMSQVNNIETESRFEEDKDVSSKDYSQLRKNISYFMEELQEKTQKP